VLGRVLRYLASFSVIYISIALTGQARMRPLGAESECVEERAEMVHRWTGEVAKPAFRASLAGFLDLFPASIQSDISISISMTSAWAECISIVRTTIEPKSKGRATRLLVPEWRYLGPANGMHQGEPLKNDLRPRRHDSPINPFKPTVRPNQKISSWVWRWIC